MNPFDLSAPIDRFDSVPRLLIAQAEKMPDKSLFSIYGTDQRLTYEQLAMAADAGSTRLRRECGVNVGEVGAIFLPNSIGFVQAWFVCLFAGVPDIPINFEFRKTALLFALSNTKVRVVFTDCAGVRALLDEEVAGYLPNLKLIVTADDSGIDQLREALSRASPSTRLVRLEDLLSEGPRARVWESVEGTSLASIRYTSGTTGIPKGIMQTHLHVLNKALVHGQIMQMTASDRLFSPFPLHHSLAGINGLIGTLQAGASMVSVIRFSASQYWSSIRASRATVGHILFPLIPLLLRQPATDLDAAHECRYLWTAWPNPEFEARFKVTLIQIYGLGELGIASFRRGGGGSHERAAGRPLPGISVSIVDEVDRPVARGTEGEITIRTEYPHGVMQGYFGNLDATIQAFRNLALHTGDRGYIDKDGELVFLGRIGDTIRRRGVNISSEQIESEILRHPQVAECAVVGVPSEYGEEDILAYVVLADPLVEPNDALGALVEFLKERVPKQYIPRYFLPTTAMPRTSTGKIRKVEMRDRPPAGARWDREQNVWN